MPDAVAEALAYGWEHWSVVAGMHNPVGYLFRVGQSKVKARKKLRLFAAELAHIPEVEPGRQGHGWLEWIEQGRIKVAIGGGRGPSAIAAREQAMRTLADLLSPITTDLDWDGGPEMRTSSGPLRPDSQPLLAGNLAGVRWQLIPDGVNGDSLELLLGEPARLMGGTPRVEPDDGTNIDFSVDPLAVPGGALLFGWAPNDVQSVRLQLANAVVELPLVAFDDDRVAFAVPLPDELDPVSVDFFGAEEHLLASIALTNMPPFGRGGLGSSVSIESD